MSSKKGRGPIDTYNQYVQDLDAYNAYKQIESLKIPIWERLFESIVVIIAIALVIAVLYAEIEFLFPGDRESGKAGVGTTRTTETTAGTEEAAEESAEQVCQVSLHVELNGEGMEDGMQYRVSSLTDEFDIYAWSTEADIDQIVCYLQDLSGDIEYWVEDGDHMHLPLPEREPGTEEFLIIEAIAENDDGSDNTVTRAMNAYWLIYE